jgi:hypothetical protein
MSDFIHTFDGIKTADFMEVTSDNIKPAQDYRSLSREDIVKLLEQKDAELKDKDAELERKSRRILELERMIFGRRSEKHLPKNPNGWTGTLFDEQ